jgi:type IV secretion system VirB5/TraC/TraE/TrbJ family protein
LLTALFSFCAYADGPAYVVEQNLENTAQNIYNLNQQMYTATKQNTMATESMSRTVQSSLTGNNSIGLLNNSASEQAFRNWTPTASDLANMVAQGLQTGNLADQIKYYNQKFKIPTAAELMPNNPASPAADYGVFSAVSTNTALSVADKGFDNVQQVQDQINFLYQELDRQQTLKQSQDFNSVILLKIAALQTDLIRLQAQQLKIQAVSQQENNIKRTTMSQFVEDIK